MGVLRSLGVAATAVLLAACEAGAVHCGGCFSHAYVNVDDLPVSVPYGSVEICTDGGSCQTIRLAAGVTDVRSVALDPENELTAKDLADRKVTATLEVAGVAHMTSTKLTYVPALGDCGCEMSWGELAW